MTSESLKELIKRELPALLRSDPALRRFILDLTRETYADRRETEDRFDRILEELRNDREEQARKWDANQAELRRDREERARVWDEYKVEQNLKWEDQNRKWDDQNRKWDEQNRKWDEQNLKWEEQNRKWDENQAELKRLHEEIMAQAKKFDRSIGALGARWGIQSEKAFREALAGILEQNFGVKVLHINEYDERGEVFGRPDQVEIDVVVKNGLLLICELKSSISKSDMYIFERKARFYEQRHQQTANKRIVISPMIDAGAQKVARQLGIETYGDSTEVENL